MDRAQRFMAVAVLLSVLVHAAPIFGIRFVMPDPRTLFSGQPLEVVLVNQRTESAPTKADVEAQVNLDGGGNTDAENRRVKSPLPVQAQTSSVELERTQRKQKQLEQEAQQLMTKLDRREATLPAPQKSDKPAESQDGLDPEDLRQQARELSGSAAQISKRWEQYQTRPRKTFIGARAKEYRFARYVEDWRMKVERLGNLSYPVDKYGQKLYGRLLLNIEIDASGNLMLAEVAKSSGNAELDAAAIAIVKRAAPFGPFPPEIRKDTDIIGISRTWTFAKGDSVIGDD
ncbi:energy transducer TonB family protein [Chitinolyticbacter meiyuanensis]|uniref:energy transducer TonB family protein n=1 Tax=Chitinolyticbacter meiyuanensis TaxID=682798 RepID=UPI0011E5926D|nr:energy transducer TonB [Chitinolyticbacter meiyuanensis]